MSASKALLSFSKSIVVDVSETAGLPALVKNSYRTGGASIPIVILIDPSMEKIYGRFDHIAMKTQKYGTIFKEAKNDIAKAKKAGTFTKAPVIVKVEGEKVDAWKSAAGTIIKAKLIGIEDDATYIFETEAGKTFRATAKQLDKESVAKARKAAGLK